MEETITYHTCSKCGEEKPLTEEYFTESKRHKSGFMNCCKLCVSKKNKEYYKNNRKKILQQVKEYRENNPEKRIYSNKKYRQKNQNKITKYRQENKLKTKEYNKQYYLDNREELIEKTIIYRNERLKVDEIFYIWETIRHSLKCAFKRMKWTKNSKTQDYLKCDYQTFKEHIENQFIEGMSWDNRDEWHLDHYYPVSLAQTEDDMYIFNHYTNFQPLWAKDNLEKSNKVPDGFEEWYEMMKEKVFVD